MHIFSRFVRAICSASAVLFLPKIATAIIGSPNPFTSEQCDAAIRHAERLRYRPGHDGRWEMMRAEALLCIGLQDDPGALDLAMKGFARLIEHEPLNFFSYLYYAEAVRARYPLSEEAVNAFSTARRALDSADVGAVRSDLFNYIDRAIGEIKENRDHFAEFIAMTSTVVADPHADSILIGDRLVLLARTGPIGLHRAREMLDVYLNSHEDKVLATFYRAELSRGDAPRAQVASLYGAAANFLCGNNARVGSETLCAISKDRLKVLERVSPPIKGPQDLPYKTDQVDPVNQTEGGPHEADHTNPFLGHRFSSCSRRSVSAKCLRGKLQWRSLG